MWPYYLLTCFFILFPKRTDRVYWFATLLGEHFPFTSKGYQTDKSTNHSPLLLTYLRSSASTHSPRVNLHLTLGFLPTRSSVWCLYGPALDCEEIEFPPPHPEPPPAFPCSSVPPWCPGKDLSVTYPSLAGQQGTSLRRNCSQWLSRWWRQYGCVLEWICKKKKRIKKIHFTLENTFATKNS